MAFMEWTQDLEVGEETIDFQHKNLVRLINDLYDEKQNAGSELILEVILDELVQYTKYHFHSEEILMKGVNYKDIDSHILKHQGFVKEIEGFKESYLNNNVDVSDKILTFLLEWLKAHILKEDQKLSSLLS